MCTGKLEASVSAKVLNILTADILRNNRIYFRLCQQVSRFFHTPVWTSVWRGTRQQHSPGRVSPQCERVDASSALNSPQMPCRTRRTRAHEARGCANAFSWQSYPWTSWCIPDLDRNWIKYITLDGYTWNANLECIFKLHFWLITTVVFVYGITSLILILKHCTFVAALMRFSPSFSKL